MKLALHWQIILGMAIGAVVGIVLNATVSERESSFSLSEEERQKALPATVVLFSASDRR